MSEAVIAVLQITIPTALILALIVVVCDDDDKDRR